jgi:hypothetical protein
MAEARAKERWSHTGSILCLLANLHRDPKKHRPFKPGDFSPFQTKARPAVKDTATGFRIMKHLFVDKGQ